MTCLSKDTIFDILQGIDPFQQLLSEDPDLFAIAQDIAENIGDAVIDEVVLGEKDVQNYAEDISEIGNTESSPTNAVSDTVVPFKQCDENTIKKFDMKTCSYACQVCNGCSKVSLHLGALVCLSCRAFFVRANKDDNFKNFECSKQNLDLLQCSVDSKSYRSCKLCRFNRCVQVGMILPDKEREKTKNNKKTTVAISTPEERIKYHTKVVEHIKSTRHARIWEAMLANTLLTFEDMGVIEGFPNLETELDLKVIPDIGHHNINLLHEILQKKYNQKHSFQWYTEKNYFDYELFVANQIFLRLSSKPWSTVKSSDRTKLVASNSLLVLEYILAHRIGKREYNMAEVDKLVTYLTSDPDESFRSQVKSIHKKVSKNGKLRPHMVTYETIYDPDILGLESPDAKEDHKTAAVNLSRVGLANNHRFYDEIVRMLTIGIILHTPDFLDLDEPRKVEEVQTFYASLLWRYLKGQSSEVREVMLRDSMLASSYARQLWEVRRKAMQWA